MGTAADVVNEFVRKFWQQSSRRVVFINLQNLALIMNVVLRLALVMNISTSFGFGNEYLKKYFVWL